MLVEVLQQQQKIICLQGYTIGGSRNTNIYVGADIGHQHIEITAGMYPKAGAYRRILHLVSVPEL